MSPDALPIGDQKVIQAEIAGPWGIPSSWAWAPLGSLAPLISRGRAPDYVDQGGIPVLNQRCIRWGAIDFGFAKRTSCASLARYPADLIIEDGDILWNSTGSGTIGRAAVYRVGERFEDEPFIDTHITLVRCKHVLPDYIGYFAETLHVQKIISDLNVGSTNQSELPRSVVAALAIPLPPLPEQRRIVARIGELFAEIAEGEAALNRARRRLDTWRRALLKAAVTGELTRDWRESNRPSESGAELVARIIQGASNWLRKAKPQPPSIDRPRGLPPEWGWASIDQLIRGDRSLAYGVLQPGPEFDGGVPLIRVGDITKGRVNLIELKRINPAVAAEYSRTRLSGGELLITLVGAIGRTAITPLGLAGANTARAVGVIPLTDLVNQNWVELWFRNPSKQIEMIGKAHEVARKTLNLEDVRSAGVAIPPRQEQDQIAALSLEFLGDAETEEAGVIVARSDADALRQSILKAAFEGRLVPQDPADEPASALLARLRENSLPQRRSRGRGRQFRMAV